VNICRSGDSNKYHRYYKVEDASVTLNNSNTDLVTLRIVNWGLPDDDSFILWDSPFDEFIMLTNDQQMYAEIFSSITVPLSLFAVNQVSLLYIID